MVYWVRENGLWRGMMYIKDLESYRNKNVEAMMKRVNTNEKMNVG